MTCEEFQDLAAAYALGALDPDERAAADAHLADPTHRGCDEALRRAYGTVGAIGAGLPPVTPGEGVWRAVEARMGGEGGARLDRDRRRPFAWAAAAAATLFLVLWIGERRSAERAREGLTVAQRQSESQGQARAAVERELAQARTALDAQRQVVALLGTPGSRVVTLDPAPGHSGGAAAVLNLRARLAVIVSTSLAPRPGKSYQLWVIRGAAAPSPAGFLQATGGILVGQIDPALLAVAPDALAVSLEPAGGSPAPTDVTLVGKIPG